MKSDAKYVGKIMNDDELEKVTGGVQDSFNGVPLYDYTKFEIAVTRGVTPGLTAI